MRKFLVGVAVAVLLCVGLMGCEPESGVEAKQEAPPNAASFKDDQRAFYDMQMECPVCGGQPIKQEFNVDTNEGRVYFDKQECQDKFEQDQQKHMKAYKEKINKMMMGGGSSQ